MRQQTARINVTLPKDLIESMNQIAGPRFHGRLIAESLRKHIRQIKEDELERQLEEGYRATAKECRALAREFEAADLEGWNKEQGGKSVGVPDKKDSDAGHGVAQVYEQRLCAFVDILGFSDLVERSIRSNALQQKIRELLRRVIDAKPVRDSWWVDIIEARLRVQGIPNPRSEAEQKVASYAAAERGTNFSDNIVLSATLNAHAISTLITSLIFLSRDAAALGSYVRGGICQGLLCHEVDLCFGPALIAAHDLEQKVAFYPRIVVTPDAYKAIAAVDTDVIDPLASYVKADFDGERFLHFLSPQFMKQSKSTALAEQMSETRRRLSHWLSKVKPGDPARPKYIWLARYFNSVLEESPASGMELFSIES